MNNSGGTGYQARLPARHDQAAYSSEAAEAQRLAGGAGAAIDRGLVMISGRQHSATTCGQPAERPFRGVSATR
jgi:hypothetical protein